MKYRTLVLSAFMVFAAIEARADNMASIAITPATGAVTLVPRWAIGGSLAGFHLMAQDLSLGGGANQFYSIKGTPIPAGGDIAAFTRYIAGSGAATNLADIGSKLTPNSYSALTSADPDVGYGSVNLYFIHHKSTGDYFSVIVPSSGTASAVTDLKPMNGPGGPATGSAPGYFGLTFAAANLGYGLNIFYYLRTDPVTGFTRFGTLVPALLATSADQFDLGMGGHNALAFTGTDVGFGTDKMYYLRLDPVTGFTILGTLHPVTGRASDIANLGSVYSTLTFVPGDVGFGSGRFYTTGAVNTTWQSVSFAAIADRAISAGSFTVNPSASSGLPIALTVVPGSAGSASISGPVAGVFTVTPLAPGLIMLQATQAGQLAPSAFEFTMLRQGFTASGVALLAITAQPTSQSAVTGTTAVFSVTASGTTALHYRWQWSTDGATWSDLSNNSTYSGVATAKLTISGAALALNGRQYRCVVTNAAGSATSNAASLRVILPDQAFLHQLFLDVLGREIDAGALSSFGAALAGGRSRAELLGDLFGSAEYNLRQIDPVIRLYYAALARPPDKTGLQNWSNALRPGVLTLTGAAGQFVGSAEFLLHYGTLSNTQYVQQLYRNVLGREADTAGLADWVAQLNSGASRGAVLVGFSESDEFKVNIADQVEIVRLYFLLLQRMPTTAELQSWQDFLLGYDQTDGLFAQSYPSGITDRAYVQLVFRGFLRRDADAGELSTFGAALGAGIVSHASLVDTLLNSTEFNLFVAPVSRLYLAALRRVPDAPGLYNWVAYVRAGNSLQVMADAFAASQEFTNRYGAMSNNQYVAQLYRDVLGREGDSAGLAHWTGLLNTGGSTRGQILIGFSESQEAIHLFAPTLRTFLSYFTFLNATPTQQDLDYWKDYLATLTDQLRDDLLADPVFSNGG